MQYKQTKYGDEARSLLMAGITELFQSVVSTLGPSGKNVLIERGMGIPHVTKDGVTVAIEQGFKDKYMNMGAQMVKQAAIKTGEIAGDGTTTSIVLAMAMIEAGNKVIATGSNPVTVKRDLDALVESLCLRIDEMSRDMETDDEIRSVATISANNDATIGSLISKAALNVGKDGFISVEESKTGKTWMESVSGMQMDTGMISPYFMTDTSKMECVLNKPKILLFDNKVSELAELLPFMEQAKKNNRPLLIMADDISNDALSALIMNHINGNIKVCAVKTPGMAHSKMEKLKDIAVYTGGVIVSKDTGKTPMNTAITELGSSKSVVVKKNKTIIIDGDGDQSEIEERVNEIRTHIKDKGTHAPEAEMKARISGLTGGVSIIHVFASTEVEMRELKDRIDDSIHATLAAMDGGIVPGGGLCLMRCKKDIDPNVQQTFGSVMESPFMAILKNTGVNPYEIMPLILRESDIWWGYNAASGEIGDMKEFGVIDPAKVVKTALRNAASVAGMFFITDCVMVQDNDGEPNRK